jgi:iron complex transport system ATP-binding protein
VGFTHALLLKKGGIVAAGPLDEALTADTLTETFDMTIELNQADGRYAARAA